MSQLERASPKRSPTKRRSRVWCAPSRNRRCRRRNLRLTQRSAGEPCAPSAEAESAAFSRGRRLVPGRHRTELSVGGGDADRAARTRCAFPHRGDRHRRAPASRAGTARQRGALPFPGRARPASPASSSARWHLHQAPRGAACTPPNGEDRATALLFAGLATGSLRAVRHPPRTPKRRPGVIQEVAPGGCSRISPSRLFARGLRRRRVRRSSVPSAHGKEGPALEKAREIPAAIAAYVFLAGWTPVRVRRDSSWSFGVVRTPRKRDMQADFLAVAVDGRSVTKQSGRNAVAFGEPSLLARAAGPRRACAILDQRGREPMA